MTKSYNWESFYWSVSKTDRLIVTHDLVIIHDKPEDGYIPCEVLDTNFQYTGWCFPMQSHLYLMLEKVKLYNEIIVYLTNLPDRHPPVLYGIILCTSGGVDDTHIFPCAAKVAFRYLGNDSDLRQKFKLAATDDLRAYLATTHDLPGYLDPKTVKDSATKAILDDVKNVIKPSDIPGALRMTK